MTVNELKNKLEGFDGNLKIALYVQEDMDWARAIRVEEKENASYCKGDHVLNYSKDTEKILVIGDM